MSDDESTTPTLRELLRRRIAAETSKMRTMLPARVVAFDVATQRASVQVEIQRVDFDETGARRLVTLPIVTDVPVGMLGTKRVRVLFELVAGDPVMYVVASSAIERWKARGGTVDPGSDHHHHLSDGIAIPLHFGHDEVDAPTVIEITSTSVIVHAGTAILLGAADADDPAIRKSDLDEFISTFNSHIHLESGASTAAPTTPQSPIAGSPKVRLE